jgi:xanthine dehydrogenase/oxidase
VVYSIYLFQVHASQTEEFLNGKALDTKTIQGAMDVLEKELNPDEKPPDASPEYRKTLAQALLYKVRAMEVDYI